MVEVSWWDASWGRTVSNFFLREINVHRCMRSNLRRGSVSTIGAVALGLSSSSSGGDVGGESSPTVRVRHTRRRLAAKAKARQREFELQAQFTQAQIDEEFDARENEGAAAPPASSSASISATVFVADSGTCWHRNKFCHLLQGEIIRDLPRPPNDLPPCDVCKDASGSGVQVPESDANSMLDRPHDCAMRELGPDQRDWWLTRSGWWWTRRSPEHDWYPWQGERWATWLPNWY